jgi:hypothetical protein
MSREIYELCQAVLLEIEMMQNRTDVALRLALDLGDAAIMDDLAGIQANLHQARERLVQQMRAAQPAPPL